MNRPFTRSPLFGLLLFCAVCLMIGGAVLILLAFGRPRSVASVTNDAGADSEWMHPQNLLDAYNANEAAADQKYTGRTVTLLMIGAVDKTKDGGYRIVNAWPWGEVHCVLSASDAAGYDNKHVLIRGTCQGKKKNIISVTGCKILEHVHYDNDARRWVKD